MVPITGVTFEVFDFGSDKFNSEMNCIEENYTPICPERLDEFTKQTRSGFVLSIPFAACLVAGYGNLLRERATWL